ncbi:MAG: molybdenum cofactor guanylyltransferase [Gammaproteobacteria bacterium]|nr:molybdenum cofactor guanylyltransferase [Gammaproteobacteria bacterium]
MATDRASIARHEITGVILAGGRGSRLGGVDKGLVRLHGRPLIEHVIDALRPQAGKLMISANRNQDVYASYGFPVIADVMGDYDGPLAGMLSAMRCADTSYVFTVPCDVPVPPANLVERLVTTMTMMRRELCIASCAGQVQPVFALMSRALADRLQEYLVAGERGVENWMRRQQAALADFPDHDAFTNINTPEDLRRLEGRSLRRT